MSDKGREREKLEVVIFGCGAMAVETAMYLNDINLQDNISGEELIVTDIVSSSFTRLGDIQNILGYEVNTYTEINEVASFHSKRSVIAIGANSPVLKIRKDVLDVGGSFISIIHPSSHISPTSKIGDGVIVAPFSFVGPFARVGHNSILNVRSTIGHDVVVGIGVIISPHVDINGTAKIGDHCFIGAGVTVDPLIEVGSFCKLSSGVTLKNNVKSGVLVINRSQVKQIRMFSEKDGSSLFKGAGA